VCPDSCKIPASVKDSTGYASTHLGRRPLGLPAGGAAPEPASRAERVLTRLVALRAELAGREGVPPQMLWPDPLVQKLAGAHPRRPEALLQVHGITRDFADRWGQAVLAAINEGLDANRARNRVGDDAPRPQRRRDRGELPAGPSDAAPPTAEQREVYGRLRELRSRLAREQELPAYCVFADKTLVELAKQHPTSLAEMRRVPGIGPAKIEKYGDAFLEILRQG
jgi:superfamily II DNA helicase RecQ